MGCKNKPEQQQTLVLQSGSTSRLCPAAELYRSTVTHLFLSPLMDRSPASVKTSPLHTSLAPDSMKVRRHGKKRYAKVSI